MSLTPIVSSGIVGAYTKTRLGAEVSWNLHHELRDQFTDGTGIGAVNIAYDAEPVIGSGATLNLDLAGGGLLNPFGDSLTFVKVKAMRYESAEANTTNVTIGAGSNPFLGPLGAAGTHVLKPGGVYLWSDPNGYTVTAATGDNVQHVNAAGAGATVKITIIGTDA
jgi:hypothetical protein